MTQSVQCISCKHYRSLLTCDAFPHGIPEEIATGEFDHRKPFKGDNGIRFESTKGSAAEILERDE